MITEEEKNQNLMRLMNLMIAGMAKTLYDMFDETAFAAMSEVGRATLEIMEQERGLQIGEEDPQDVLEQIGRIFVQEMGFIESFNVTRKEDKLKVTVSQCQGWDLTQSILKAGVDVPFTCPIMNVCQAALIRTGNPVQKSISPIPETHGSTITFTLMDN